MADYELETIQLDEPMVSYHPEEEQVEFYFLNDLIWEYNYRVQTDRQFGQGKHFLSLLSPASFDGDETLLAPLSQEEAKKAEAPPEKKDWWDNTKDAMIAALPFAISKIPDIKEVFRLKTLIQELGVQGKIYYKMTKGNIYVIIKGNPRLRNILTGTRYSNFNPKIVKLGLSKVDFAKAFKGTAVVALIFYGLAKTAEGVTMYLEDGEIRPGFFSEIPAEVTKLLLSALAATAMGCALATFGFPVAVAAAGALVMGYVASWALDKFDEKVGFTKAVREATETLTVNMQREWVDFKSTLEQAALKSMMQARDAAIRLLLAKAQQEAEKAIDFDYFLFPRMPIYTPKPIQFNNPLKGLEQLFRAARDTIQFFNQVVSYTRIHF
jgi:hypothetical protein